MEMKAKMLYDSEFIHPEASAGEVFFTNSDEEGFVEMRFSTKRKGNHAFDGRGNPISKNNWFPVFLHLSELSRLNRSLPDIRRQFRMQRNNFKNEVDF